MRLVADLHTHTISCGHAYSTVLENARAAQEKGLKMIAITDHGPAMPGGPHQFYFKNIGVIPPVIEGVEILRGAEANIISFDGELDLPDHILEKLDIVLAGFHKRVYTGGTPEENTKAMINAMRNPFVDIIVHPCNPQFQVIIPQIVEAAIEHGKLLEINNSSLTITRKGSAKNCAAIAEWVVKLNGRVVLGSDAHISFDVGCLEQAVKLAIQAGLREDQVLNTSLKLIKDFLGQRLEHRRRARPVV